MFLFRLDYMGFFLLFKEESKVPNCLGKKKKKIPFSGIGVTGNLLKF